MLSERKLDAKKNARRLPGFVRTRSIQTGYVSSDSVVTGLASPAISTPVNILPMSHALDFDKLGFDDNFIDDAVVANANPVRVFRALQLFTAKGERLIRQFLRSEERRVGKECRSRWSPYH